jgi:hypothetical protein
VPHECKSLQGNASRASDALLQAVPYPSSPF